MAEEFKFRLTVKYHLVGARGANGEIQVYPLAENVHTDVRVELIDSAIDDIELQEQAKTMFTAIAERLNYVGVLALCP